jgi:hypothetical protein
MSERNGYSTADTSSCSGIDFRQREPYFGTPRRVNYIDSSRHEWKIRAAQWSIPGRKEWANQAFLLRFP